MDKKDNNKLIINKLTEEEKKAGYDASYSYGNAKIYMVSHGIEEAAARMHFSIHGGKYKATLIKEE